MRVNILSEEYKRVSFSWGILMLRTRRGLNVLDRFSKFRITKPLAWVMLFLLPLCAGVAIFLILRIISVYLSPVGPEAVSYARSIPPLSNILLPGVNPYVPLVYGWIAVVVAVVVHEVSHGVIARSLGLSVKSSGIVFLFFIPIGAFVEVDEQQLKEVKARSALRVLAAGSGINFILAAACILLLILSVSTMMPVMKGAAVIAIETGTPASLANMKPGDVILAINNSSVTDLNQTLRTSGEYKPGQVINITVWRSGQTIVLRNVTLGNITVVSASNQTLTYPYLGVESVNYQSLKSLPGIYSRLYTENPLLYITEVPTIQAVAVYVPYSGLMNRFYTSPLGYAAPTINNLLFWMFFVNVNIAIFNSLPIYPMDGGQAFESFLKGAGKGRLSDETVQKITMAVTLALVFIFLAVIVGPYLTGL